MVYTEITSANTNTTVEVSRVLLVEDEESFIDALLSGLPREGFEVAVARDGIEAVKLFDEVHPDIVLLDLMLPKMSGIDVCKAIRERSLTPIIMVTAKTTELDTVLGLEIGADDYVTKPYRLRELVARMRAVLRRAASITTPEKDQSQKGQLPGSHDTGSATTTSSSNNGNNGVSTSNENTGIDPELKLMPTGTSPTTTSPTTTSPTTPPAPTPGVGILQAGKVVVDTDSHRIYNAGTEVVLPRKEFELLEIFVRNAGKVLTRDVLIDRIWGADYVGDTKTLDVHIKRLRARLQETPDSPMTIKTIRGIGYRLEA